MSSRIDERANDFLRSGVYLRGWSKTTVRTYKQGLASLQGSLGDAAVSKQTLEAWVISLREKGLTPGGINMYIRTINSFLSWLGSEGHIDKTIKLKLLPNPQKPLRGFSDNEISSLLSFRPKGFYELRTHTLIGFLMDTGCRIDEALTLKHVKCDLDNLVCFVQGKGNKERQVPISFELRKLLFRYEQVKTRKALTGREWVFCTHKGDKLSYRNTFRDIKTVCGKAGVSDACVRHVHPHAFRHHFAVTYIRRGGDIYRLSRILGHTSISTTQIYLRSMGIEQISENHSSLSPLNHSWSPSK